MSGACLIEASARELADLVRNRTVSAVEVIEAFLAEVERKNPHLNAIIRCDPQKARTEAEAADRRLAQGDPAPLLGVPFGLGPRTRRWPSPALALLRLGLLA